MKILCLALLLLTVACKPPANAPVRLGWGAAFSLRAPEAGPSFFASQEVVVQQRDGSQETCLATVENDGHRLSIVASSPVGMTLFTVQVKGGATLVDARVPLPSRVDLRLLPALIQLANWPLDDLRKGLGGSLELTEKGQVRTLSRRGRTLLTLAREGQAPPFKALLLTVPTQGISVAIRTLEDKP